MAVEIKQEMLTNFQKFYAETRLTEWAWTDRFECVFKLPNTLNSFIANLDDPEGMNLTCSDQEWYMTMLCEEIQIPGMVIQNKEVPIGAWNFMRNSNVNFLGNEINITWLTDVDWQLRHIFEAWIGHCVDPNSKQIAFPDDQYGEVWINMLSKAEDKVRTTWELMEVTPKVLNLVPVASGATSIARTTLIISSNYWRSKALDINLGKNEGGNLGL